MDSPPTDPDDINAPIDYVLEWMKENKVPLTRENYLHIACMGSPPAELDGEMEAEISREILAAELRAIRRSDAKFLRSIGVTR